jgi:glycosyltransferase involved in cell wall biosynthesis
MNLLLINHYAGGPAYGMEYRPYYLAREWVRAGHAVTIAAASYSHVRAVQPRRPDGAVASAWRERLDGIDYRWFATPPYRGNGFGRLRNIAVFMARVGRAARELVADVRPDAVIASSTYPMDIWVARRIARLSGARLVFEVHDLWPLSPIEVSGMSPAHPFIRLCAKAESDAYRDADVVVSMLPKVADYMASRGLDLRKLHIVPNGVAPEDWTDAPAPLRADVAAAISLLRAQGRAVLGYAGSMGLPNALDTLLDAAAQLRDKPVGIVLVGDGTERERLAQRITAEGLDHVKLLAPIPKAQVPSFLGAIDAAYIGWRRAPIYRFGIAPNKLMDYMMAGCAVVHGVEAGNDPVAESGCGVSVAPESAPAAAAGIERLLALPAAERRAMGERGRAFVQAHHTWPVLARRFVEAVQT